MSDESADGRRGGRSGRAAPRCPRSSRAEVRGILSRHAPLLAGAPTAAPDAVMAATASTRHQRAPARRLSADVQDYVGARARLTPSEPVPRTRALQSSPTGTARALRLADRPRCQPQPTASRPEPDTAARRPGAPCNPSGALVGRVSRRHRGAAPDRRGLVALARMRSGLFMPLFDELADPAVVARLSAEAEEAGWHGVFVWDNLRYGSPWSTWPTRGSRWRRSPRPQSGSGSARWSPHSHAVGRSRWPGKRRRSTSSAAADSRSASAWGATEFASEYSITGEELDDRRRASMLDESLEILAAAWSGEAVHHRGEHYTVDGMRFLPRPVQRPGVPVWVAGYYGKPRPMRRAARHQGFFPIELDRPNSSPKSLLTSRHCAGRPAGTPRSPTTSSSHCRLAAIRRLTPPPAPPGGSSSSHGMRYRSTRCALRSATALRPRMTCPEAVDRGRARLVLGGGGRPPGAAASGPDLRGRPAALDRPCQSERGSSGGGLRGVFGVERADDGGGELGAGVGCSSARASAPDIAGL